MNDISFSGASPSPAPVRASNSASAPGAHQAVGAHAEGVDVEGRIALDEILDDVIDELEADGRRAEARVAPRLGGAEVERRDEAGRPRVHTAAVQVAHGEARVQHATAVIAGGAEVNLEGVGLRLAQRAGHQ